MGRKEAAQAVVETGQGDLGHHSHICELECPGRLRRRLSSTGLFAIRLGSSLGVDKGNLASISEIQQATFWL